jgi:hypothetical protein
MSQQFVSVIGSKISDASGTLLQNGLIQFVGTDNTDTPISFRIGGGGIATTKPASASVINGVIASGFQVPDLTNVVPSATYYRITIIDISVSPPKTVSTFPYVRVLGPSAFDYDELAPYQLGAVMPSLSGPQGPPGTPGIGGFNQTSILNSPDGTTTVFALGMLPSQPSAVMVFLDGVFQSQPSDYSLSGTTLTYTTPPASGAKHVAMVPVAGGAPIGAVPTGTVNGTNTIFSLPSVPTTPGATMLFFGGIYQTQGIDYTLSGSTITFARAPRAGFGLYAVFY